MTHVPLQVLFVTSLAACDPLDTYRRGLLATPKAHRRPLIGTYTAVPRTLPASSAARSPRPGDDGDSPSAHAAPARQTMARANSTVTIRFMGAPFRVPG